MLPGHKLEDFFSLKKLPSSGASWVTERDSAL